MDAHHRCWKREGARAFYWRGERVHVTAVEFAYAMYLGKHHQQAVEFPTYEGEGERFREKERREEDGERKSGTSSLDLDLW